jgi:hypothetical protein
MIINDEENNIKVIYIKIPKTGSTTISSNIWENYNQSKSDNFDYVYRQKVLQELRKSGSKNPHRDLNDKINQINETVINLNYFKAYQKVKGNNPYKNHKNYGWHVPYRQINDYLNKINESIEDFSKFSTIREPVSRFVSAFRWRKEKVDHTYSIKEKEVYKSIDYYFECISNKDNRLCEFDVVFVKKQTYWLKDDNGLIPDDMKLFTIDKINEPETIDYLSDIMGFEFNTENRENVSKKKEEINISSELRSKIENYFSEDCELYEKINK